MDLLIGTLFLILVLIIFTLFTYKAPNGMRAMGHWQTRLLRHS